MLYNKNELNWLQKNKQWEDPKLCCELWVQSQNMTESVISLLTMKLSSTFPFVFDTKKKT